MVKGLESAMTRAEHSLSIGRYEYETMLAEEDSADFRGGTREDDQIGLANERSIGAEIQ